MNLMRSMLSIYARNRRVILALLLAFFLSACSETIPVPGEVALVNGEGISLREVEARRVLLFASHSPQETPVADSELHGQYRYVVSRLIQEILVCQYMEAEGKGLAPGVMEAEEKRIRDDYPEGAFEEVLVEDGLDLELWRKALYRRLLVNRFLTEILRPRISITPEEVEQYYLTHKDEFMVAEQWHYLQVSGPVRADVEQAANLVSQHQDPVSVQKDFLVNINDIRIAVHQLPKDVHALLQRLRPWQLSSIVKSDGAFWCCILLEKSPAAMLDMAVIAQRLELILAEEKLQSIHAEWLAKRLVKADVRIAPVLLAEWPEEELSMPEPVAPPAEPPLVLLPQLEDEEEEERP